MEEHTSVFVPSSEIELEAEYFLPDSNKLPQIAVILCHPHPVMGGTMANSVVSALFGEFVTRDIPVIRFNFRGAGRSGGEYDNGIGEVEDVAAVIAEFAKISGSGQMFVAGYSFGAAMGGAAAAETAEVVGYAAIAMPFKMFPHHARRMDCPKPKLFLIGTQDDFTPLAVFYEKIKLLSDPVETSEIEGADHFFSIGSREVAKKTADFCIAQFY